MAHCQLAVAHPAGQVAPAGGAFSVAEPARVGAEWTKRNAVDRTGA